MNYEYFSVKKLIDMVRPGIEWGELKRQARREYGPGVSAIQLVYEQRVLPERFKFPEDLKKFEEFKRSVKLVSWGALLTGEGAGSCERGPEGRE
ncbi:MAG: hypothetical protein Kow0069_26300 [Promethearchaeota archaeon]